MLNLPLISLSIGILVILYAIAMKSPIIKVSLPGGTAIEFGEPSIQPDSGSTRESPAPSLDNHSTPLPTQDIPSQDGYTLSPHLRTDGTSPFNTTQP